VVSGDTAAAKEAEANASGAQQPTVAYIKVIQPFSPCLFSRVTGTFNRVRVRLIGS
jgi:hypothetical protein